MSADYAAIVLAKLREIERAVQRGDTAAAQRAQADARALLLRSAA